MSRNPILRDHSLAYLNDSQSTQLSLPGHLATEKQCATKETGEAYYNLLSTRIVTPNPISTHGITAALTCRSRPASAERRARA